MSVRIIQGDCRQVLGTLPEQSVHCIVTSPPYWGLRDYGVVDQIGLEPSPQHFVSALVEVFASARRVLRDDGTLWLNLGDSYSNAGTRQGDRDGAVADSRNDHRMVGSGYRPRVDGLKNKDLVGIPWRVAFALQADGWYLRQWMPWVKKNAMPESVTDRPASACEVVFLLSKSERYFYDHEAVKLPASMSFVNDGRWETGSTDRNEKSGYAEAGAQNPKRLHKMFDKQRGHSRKHAGFNERWDAMEKQEQCGGWRSTKNSDWFFEGLLTDQDGNPLALTVNPAPFTGAHFATFPPKLIEPCILAGCPKDGVVLDPFGGAGTTGLVADRHGRSAILIELNPEYAGMANRRITDDAGMFAEVVAG